MHIGLSRAESPKVDERDPAARRGRRMRVPSSVGGCPVFNRRQHAGSEVPGRPPLYFRSGTIRLIAPGFTTWRDVVSPAPRHPLSALFTRTMAPRGSSINSRTVGMRGRPYFRAAVAPLIGRPGPAVPVMCVPAGKPCFASRRARDFVVYRKTRRGASRRLDAVAASRARSRLNIARRSAATARRAARAAARAGWAPSEGALMTISTSRSVT